MSKIDSIKNSINKIQKIAELEGIPGFSIGFFYKHENQFKSQIFPFGVQSTTSQKPVLQSSRYGIGSLSKPITTYLIAKALEDLGIKEGFNAVLEIFDTQEGFWKITLKQAFSHTSGLPSLKPLLHFFTEGIVEDRTKGLVDKIRLMAKNCQNKPNNFEYSNLIFAVAAYLVSKTWTAHKSRSMSLNTAYKDLASKYLSALGMQHTDPFGTLTSVDAWGHEKCSGDKRAIALPWTTENWIITAAPSGGFLAPVSDLLLFLQHECNHNRGGDHLLISERFHAVVRQSDDRHYVLGWVIKNQAFGSQKSLTEIFHFGGIRGFTSRMGFYPEYQCGYVILCNRGKAAEFIDQTKHYLQMGLFTQLGIAPKSIEGVYFNAWFGKISILLVKHHFLLQCEKSAEVSTLRVDPKNPYRYFFETGPWADFGGDRFLEFSPNLSSC